MIKIILLSVVTSALVSFLIMKLQMKMLEKWTDDFFNREVEGIKKHLDTSKKE